jgi:hypothetical protein
MSSSLLQLALGAAAVATATAGANTKIEVSLNAAGTSSKHYIVPSGEHCEDWSGDLTGGEAWRLQSILSRSSDGLCPDKFNFMNEKDTPFPGVTHRKFGIQPHDDGGKAARDANRPKKLAATSVTGDEIVLYTEGQSHCTEVHFEGGATNPYYMKMGYNFAPPECDGCPGWLKGVCPSKWNVISKQKQQGCQPTDTDDCKRDAVTIGTDTTEITKGIHIPVPTGVVMKHHTGGNKCTDIKADFGVKFTNTWWGDNSFKFDHWEPGKCSAKFNVVDRCENPIGVTGVNICDHGFIADSVTPLAAEPLSHFA